MKIGVVSDSHGVLSVFEDMLAVPGTEDVALWLHAGDFAVDAKVLAERTGKRFHAFLVIVILTWMAFMMKRR